MRNSSRWAGRVALASVLVGCSGGSPGTAATPVQPASLDLADRVESIVTTALHAEAGAGTADTLFLPNALVIANGERRQGAPRFAGIGPGGQVTIGATRVEVGPIHAWVVIEYRWLLTSDNRVREARATAILSAEEGPWRILHLHSSEIR